MGVVSVSFVRSRMSAYDAVDGSIHRHIGAMAVGCG
jgi:hypothetical protein